MENTYLLKIDCSGKQSVKLCEILGTGKFVESVKAWHLELVELAEDEPIDFIDKFLNILEGNFDRIFELGIQRSDISIWRYYEYDQQCGLEMHPEEMSRLGASGIVLCISCWQAGDEIEI